MSNDLVLRNRQRTRAIDLRLLRRITRTLLTEHVQGAPFVLGIHFVTELEMAQLNEHFLRHRGSTDVLTFDHAGSQHGARSTEHRSPLHGEIFISVDD
ncbi:MAG: rRNA maturation RNAse YbeY, partial [Pedosphaera parvula]|nr:rRNA maturation RNAse YbeY [Pedosphaera parvula]